MQTAEEIIPAKPSKEHKEVEPAEAANEKVSKANQEKNPSPWRRRIILLVSGLFVICTGLFLMSLGVLSLIYHIFPIRGSEQIETQKVNVAEFSEIELNGEGEIFLTQGDSYAVEVEAEDNILSEIKVEDSGDKLTISKRRGLPFIWGKKLNNRKPIKIFVSAKSLEKINISGESTFRSEGYTTEKLEIDTSGNSKLDLKKLAVKELDLNASGSFTGTIAGSANRQKVKISGSGNYDAKDLKSNEAMITISGSGSATVDASEKLEIRISGAGEVEYVGSPKKLDQEISGSGKVKQIQ